VLDQATGELDESTLVQAIVGRDLMAIEGRSTPEPDPDAPAVLQVVGLSSPLGIRAVSFTVRAGEIVGLAGLLGSGRSEILHAIFGADSRAHGDVQIDGKSLRRNPRAAVAAGVAYVPEDRASQGLFSGLPLWQNESIPDLKRLSRGGLKPRKKAERARAADAVRELGIKTRSIDTRPSELSGGNAQKVVFGKWLYGDARVWLLDEPTAGIDVGAKADILVLARRFAQEGKAVVVVCSEFEELLAICSRVLVVRGGRIVAERAAARTTEPDLLKYAHGLGDPRREEYLDHVIS
jgi:ribose transport system ATP-binding protein